MVFSASPRCVQLPTIMRSYRLMPFVALTGLVCFGLSVHKGNFRDIETLAAVISKRFHKKKLIAKVIAQYRLDGSFTDALYFWAGQADLGLLRLADNV